MPIMQHNVPEEVRSVTLSLKKRMARAATKSGDVEDKMVALAAPINCIEIK